ncbi:ParB/RepB/Spo0J family partition protein [Cupriavidus basilensis]
MSIKERLQNLSGDISVPPDVGQQESPRGASAAPKTSPGQMLAFRKERQESDQQVKNLQDRLAEFDGAEPARIVDAKLVHPSKWANRHTDSFADAEYLKLEEAIKVTGGNVIPVKIQPRDDGEYELVFGNRRHHIALKNNLPLLALVVAPLSDRELFVEMEHENRERKNPSPWEQGRSYRRALDANLWPSQNAMAAALGVSQGYISNALAVYGLPELVVGAFSSPNDIQFAWVKELGALAQLEKRALAARVRLANDVEDRNAKKVYAALTAGEKLTGITDPSVVSNNVTVKASGKGIKITCQEVTLSVETQQKLAELVDDFLAAEAAADKEKKAD